MTPRQLTFQDCEAVSDLETQLFDGRFDKAGLRALLGKPAFYGAVFLLIQLGRVNGRAARPSNLTLHAVEDNAFVVAIFLNQLPLSNVEGIARHIDRP